MVVAGKGVPNYILEVGGTSIGENQDSLKRQVSSDDIIELIDSNVVQMLRRWFKMIALSKRFVHVLM